MKKVLGLVICLMMISTVVMASPLTDYSQGKGSVDLTWRNTQIGYDDFSYDKKGALDAALTVGFGNNWAFQYRNFEPKSKGLVISPIDTETLKFATNEFNVLYKLDKNVSVFVGAVTGKATLSNTDSDDVSGSKNMWQIGVVGSTEIAPKTTLWGSMAAGSNSLTNWEVGVGYELAQNLEFNVNYREIKSTANVGYEDFDLKAKGLGVGVTYKF